MQNYTKGKLLISDIDYKEVAAQLRKPQGEFGKIVAGKMNEGNKILTSITYNSISKFAGDEILEIGFGNGFFLPELFEAGIKKIYGIDYSELMLTEASKILHKYIEENRIELKLGTADKIPFPDINLSKICTINTIYFWDDNQKVVEEIKRVLKPGGIASIGYRSKTRMKDLEFAKYGFNMFDINDVELLFCKNGFKLVGTVTEDEEIYDAVCSTFIKGE